MSSSFTLASTSSSSQNGLGKTSSFSSKSSVRRISRRRLLSSSSFDTSSATTEKNNSNNTKTKTRGSRRATKTAAAAASGGAATAKASKSSSLKKRDNEWILQARDACVSSESSSESWVERMRSSASKQLSESKTPTNRDESWRFFDVSEITSATLVREDDSEADVEEDMKAFLADVPEGAKVVAFVNGRFSEKWSSIDEDDKNGVSISRTISGDIATAIGTYDEDEEVEGQDAIFARINKSCARSDNVACITVKSENVENIVYIIHARRSSKDRKDGELATGANARVLSLIHI